MAWRWTPYAILLVALAVFSALVALYVWRYRHTRSSKMGSLLLLAGAVWIAGYALELASVDLATKLLWAKVKLLSTCFIPSGWLSYALLYTGRDKWLTRRHLALLSVIPTLFLLLILTNESHGLIWRHAPVETQGPFVVLRPTYGAGFWAYAVYSYLLILAGILVLAQALVRSGHLYGWQVGGLILAVLAPWLVHAAMDLLGWNPLPHLELTPLMIGITIPIMAWGFYRLRLRDIGTVARDTVVEGMQDGVLVLDSQERIVDLNAAAQHIIGVSRTRAVGQRVGQMWPEWLNQADSHGGATESARTVVTTRSGHPHVYDVRISPLADWRGRVVSQVVVLRDITALERQTAELSTLLEATQALSSTLDLEKVLTTITEKMAKAVNTRGCAIFRWDREAGTVATWILPPIHDPQLGDGPGAAYELNDFPAARAVLESRRPLVVRASDPDADPAKVAQMQKAGAASLLMLPLTVADYVIGLIELDDGRDRDFTVAEIRLCQALAHQAAAAIENAQLYRASHRRLDELNTLSQLGITLSSSLDAQDILDTLAREAVHLLEASSACVCHWDDAQRAATVIAKYCGPYASSQEQISDPSASYSQDVRIAELLRRHERFALCWSDPDLPPAWREHLEAYGGKSVLFLPLTSWRDAQAYLEIWESRFDRRFTDNEMLLGRSLASQAGVALGNARLYAETQKRLQEQIALREASTAISSALDLQTVLAHIAEQMGRAIDATSAYISSYEPQTMMAIVLAEYIGPRACAAERVSDLGVAYVEDGEVEWLELMQSGQHDTSHIDNPNLLESERDHMQMHGAKSILYVPLRVKEEFIGYAELWESERLREFTPEEISLCQNIAQYAAIALENAQLYRQAQQEIAERRQAEEQVKASLREKTALLQEIHHRVKNNLQIISSLLSLQSRSAHDPAVLEILKDSQSRIRSMALVHEKLYQSSDLARVDFAEYVQSLGRYLWRSYGVSTSVVRLTVDVEDVLLDVDTAIPCGLMINELMTNSLKHAFPSGQGGEIRVELCCGNDGQLVLLFRDDGIGLPEDVDIFNSPSLGLQLVNSLVVQLEGTIELDRDGGTAFKIMFPAGERVVDA